MAGRGEQAGRFPFLQEQTAPESHPQPGLLKAQRSETTREGSVEATMAVYSLPSEQAEFREQSAAREGRSRIERGRVVFAALRNAGAEGV